MRKHNVASGQNAKRCMESYYKRTYGLSMEQVTKMRSEGCEICGSSLADSQLHIDHDHQTGKFRGVLCMNCNTGIGRFQDDPQLLEAAARYLIRPLEDAGLMP
jgi:hypothetical protein